MVIEIILIFASVKFKIFLSLESQKHIIVITFDLNI